MGEDIPPVIPESIDKIKVAANGPAVLISLRVTDEMIDRALKGK